MQARKVAAEFAILVFDANGEAIAAFVNEQREIAEDELGFRRIREKFGKRLGGRGY